MSNQALQQKAGRDSFLGQHAHACSAALSRIVAGLANGNCDTIAAIINNELDGADHTLVEYFA